MRQFSRSLPILTGLILIGCSDGQTTTTPERVRSADLTGEWQSLEDANYMLKFNADTYREFYENEEMSRDQWQAVKSCDDPQPVDKTSETYAGFQIWTKPTDSRICYAISDWTTDAVSFSYSGTTRSYRRAN